MYSLKVKNNQII